MASQLDKNPIPTPTSSVKDDAFWHARTERLDAFLSDLHKRPPAAQRTSLKQTLDYLGREKKTAQNNNAPFEDLLHYDGLIHTVSQELEDLNNTHPESKKDKVINLTSAFAKAALDTSIVVGKAAYKIAKPIAIKGVQIAWAVAVWTGTKIAELVQKGWDEVADDIGYEFNAIKNDVLSTINDTRDEIAYMYQNAAPKIMATTGVAGVFGTIGLVWHLSNPTILANEVPAAPLADNNHAAAEVAVAFQGAPETTKTHVTEEWNPKIEGSETQPHKKKQKKTEIDLETITVAANIAANNGLSAQYAATVALIESGGNPKAHNPSGAKGVYQFMPSTAASYGLEHPFNAVANTKAFVQFTKDNKEILTGQLGREPSDLEKYLAHQQGAGGAAKLLTNPDTPAIQLVGRNAIVQNGGTSKMTADDFVSMWKNKYAQKEAALEIREVR